MTMRYSLEATEEHGFHWRVVGRAEPDYSEVWSAYFMDRGAAETFLARHRGAEIGLDTDSRTSV